jgi:hypothetical protein
MLYQLSYARSQSKSSFGSPLVAVKQIDAAGALRRARTFPCA